MGRVSTLLPFLLQYAVLVAGVPLALALLVRSARAPADRTRCRRTFFALIVSVAIQPADQAVVRLCSLLRPVKLDLYVYALEGSMGGHPSFVLGRFADHHVPVAFTLGMAYQLLPAAAVLVYMAYLWLRPRAEQTRLLLTFALNLAVAPLFYLLVPVCGPAFAFAHFPEAAGTIIAHPVLLDAAPNGIPSVHLSTALLILYFARRWPAGRVLGSLYLVLVGVATLASGQHYWPDLVAAVPYTLGIVWLGSRAARLLFAPRKPRTTAQVFWPASSSTGVLQESEPVRV